MKTYTHRKFIIFDDPWPVNKDYEFEYQHFDFKGKGDPRFGSSVTLEGAKELIDEYYKECSIDFE